MRLAREIKGAVEAAGEIAFQPGDASRVEFLEVLRAAGEIDQFSAVARRRDDETARDRGDRNVLRPELQRLDAERRDDRFGAFQLAPGSDHAASVSRAA